MVAERALVGGRGAMDISERGGRSRGQIAGLHIFDSWRASVFGSLGHGHGEVLGGEKAGDVVGGEVLSMRAGHGRERRDSRETGRGDRGWSAVITDQLQVSSCSCHFALHAHTPPSCTDQGPSPVALRRYFSAFPVRQASLQPAMVVYSFYIFDRHSMSHRPPAPILAYAAPSRVHLQQEMDPAPHLLALQDHQAAVGRRSAR